MPTSAPGSRPPAVGRRAARGFTLIELIIVFAIVAVSIGLIALTLRSGVDARLGEEADRLSALLEMARAEARVAGSTVRWVPRGAQADSEIQFRFVGLPLTQNMPTRWLDPATRAQVIGAPALLLGPEAILPPQRVLLTLGDRRVELASDGLGPFVVATAPATAGGATP